MNTHRETILSAILTRLSGSTPAGANVFRSREEALTRDELPAIVIKPGAEQLQAIARELVMRQFDIHIEFHARGMVADQIADPVIAAAHQLILSDDTLGGLVARITEKETAAPEFAEADQSAVHITVTYLATYATTAKDITTNV